ncbi:MAG: SPFH domain-containing protein [Deinococcales bacterium]
MIASFFIIASLVLFAVSIFGSSFLPAFSPWFIFGFAVILFAIGLVIWLIKNFYIKPSANQAYVITGLGGRKVLIDSGSLFFPLVQERIPVSLETMKLDVERAGDDALITKDNLRVDVKGEFYIKVLPRQDDVINAARSLGDKSVNATSVSNLVFEKLVSALRSVAATKNLVEIHSQRDEFASGVQQLVLGDLEQNGLTLESVTISKLDQTNQELLNDGNIFDAQGKRKITEITQAAMVERNRLEQEAMREMTIKNVATRKEVLEFERDQAVAEAEQQAKVAQAQAERKREADTYRISQEQLTREAEISKDEAVQAREVQRDQELVRRRQELEKADVERLKVIEIAQRQKEIALAEAARARAEAETAYLKAQAEREGAEQQIATVQRLAEAERDAQTKLIAAKQKIEEDRVRQETEAEVKAFAELKKAEADKQAALFTAEAIRAKAQAEAQAKEVLAQGETALKRVDVDIDRERVKIEQERVEVERQTLENKQTYSQAALEFELAKFKVASQKDVQVEVAKAIGQFMSQGNMTIFGSPETMSKMMQDYLRGMGWGQTLDGMLDNTEAFSNGKLQEVMSSVKNVSEELGQIFKGSSDHNTSE